MRFLCEGDDCTMTVRFIVYFVALRPKSTAMVMAGRTDYKKHEFFPGGKELKKIIMALEASACVFLLRAVQRASFYFEDQ